MSHRYIPNPTPCGRSRRQFLWEVGGGFAGLALTDLLIGDGFFTRTAAASDNLPGAGSLLAAKTPHFPAKAKHAVFLFMNGAPSQVDTFDPKPAAISSIELSTNSLIRWCSPVGPVLPMYILGRLRTASNPLSTWIFFAV